MNFHLLVLLLVAMFGFPGFAELSGLLFLITRICCMSNVFLLHNCIRRLVFQDYVTAAILFWVPLVLIIDFHLWVVSMVGRRCRSLLDCWLCGCP